LKVRKLGREEVRKRGSQEVRKGRNKETVAALDKPAWGDHMGVRVMAVWVLSSKDFPSTLPASSPPHFFAALFP
jgi:hypothetical protein